jgi:hypothetical protein
MPDDAVRPSAVTPLFEALRVACATRGAPAECRSAIAGAIDSIDKTIRAEARAGGPPVERAWRELLERLRHEVKQPHETEVLTCLMQAQALVLARAFPKLGPDNLRSSA